MHFEGFCGSFVQRLVRCAYLDYTSATLHDDVLAAICKTLRREVLSSTRRTYRVEEFHDIGQGGFIVISERGRADSRPVLDLSTDADVSVVDSKHSAAYLTACGIRDWHRKRGRPGDEITIANRLSNTNALMLFPKRQRQRQRYFRHLMVFHQGDTLKRDSV